MFEKFKLNRNLQTIPFKMMYNMSMLRRRFSNERSGMGGGGGGGGALNHLTLLFCKSVYFRLTTHFQKHFEDILDHCSTRYHRLRLLAYKKWGPSPSTLIQIYIKYINNASDQCLNTARFRPLLPRTISSVKFNGSKISLFGLPSVCQNTLF